MCYASEDPKTVRRNKLTWLACCCCRTRTQTDDVGVFRSPSSNEYLLAADHFDLTRADLVQLSAGAISSIFAGRAEKDRLLRLLGEFAAAEQLAADIGNGRAKH